MASLPSLLAGLPTSPAFTTGLASLPRFSATVDGAPISIAVLRKGAPSETRFFLSANENAFHELARSETAYPHAVPNFHPILTRTPGLISMAVIDQENSILLLRNDPANAQKLQTVSLVRHQSLNLQEAALFVYSDGEWPVLEGSLRQWWERVQEAPPSQEVSVDSLVHVVRRAAHKLNNAMSSSACGTEIAFETISALQSLFEALKGSSAVGRALARASENDPAVADAIEELRAVLPCEARQETDPIELILAGVKDMKQQNEDAKTAGNKTLVFVRAMQTRIPNEVPIGASTPEDLILECEDAYETGVVSPAAVAPVDEMADITAPLLLVEDEAQVREMLKKVLDRKGFKNVVTAASVSEALEAAGKIPDLRVVLTDFNLSTTETGLDLVRALKKRRPDLRVLFLSGNLGELQESFTDEEAERYDRLPKPVDGALLNERLRNLFKI